MELNAEQIIKALECCHTLGKDCLTCPYENDASGCIYLERNALALINSYEQKIKELTEENEARKGLNTMLNNELRRLGEENERLQKALNTDISIVRVSRGNGKTAHLRELGRIKVDAIRADTVRKMHTEIKERCIKGGIYPVFVARTIENVAKEMLEGKDENKNGN